MGLEKIKDELECIEKTIFESSLQQNISLEKLSKLYSNLIKIRGEFLGTSFLDSTQKESEGIRYKIQESILNIKILIREKKKLNNDIEISQMAELLNLY